ncbi:MAG TPA: FRG domain-containing protein [Gaiellaceae bacterium]|nr:FRG domain-containing protein [Gaiellaceae bacterium]
METRVTGWTELNETLFADAWQEELGLHRSDYAFRGCSDAARGLTSTLTRLGDEIETRERHLVRNFRKYAARDAVPVDSPWNWLALGQHHGLPTRLLDWTFSPYVALHFATANLAHATHDAAVWMVDHVQAHRLLPDPLRGRVVEGEGAIVFTTELLGDAVPDLPDLARFGEDFVLFVEPPSFDERIVNQYALFSLTSRPDLSLDEWLEDHPKLWRKVVIPAELKWEVRDKLDQANVTERVLFPGLDGLSAWLARHYLPRRAETDMRSVPALRSD